MWSDRKQSKAQLYGVYINPIFEYKDSDMLRENLWKKICYANSSLILSIEIREIRH